jgi:TRAP-type uncharacterized transport system substrate-binding protein
MKKLILSFLAALLAATVQAQSPFQGTAMKVKTGGEKGTYHAMFANLIETCGPLEEELSPGGSEENVEALIANKASAAFVQSDVLFFWDNNVKKLDNVRTVYALHNEEVHFATPVQTRFHKSEYGGLKKTDIAFNQVADLAGQPVGAVGGSKYTAEFISQKGNLNLQIRQFASNDELRGAMERGEIAAGIYVGGQPLGSVEALGAGFKLLPFNEMLISALSRWYEPAKLSYPKMGAKGTPTIAAEALLVGRTLNNQEKVKQFAALRDCITQHLGDLQDNGHPKWQDVKAENRGKWTWYELPSTKPATVTKAAKKK